MNGNWILYGALCTALAVVNLVRGILGKPKGHRLLLFASMSLWLMTLLEEYRMVYKWVAVSDWSALMDVVPGMNHVLGWFTAAGIALNGAALLCHYLRGKRSS